MRFIEMYCVLRMHGQRLCVRRRLLRAEIRELRAVRYVDFKLTWMAELKWKKKQASARGGLEI